MRGRPISSNVTDLFLLKPGSWIITQKNYLQIFILKNNKKLITSSIRSSVSPHKHVFPTLLQFPYWKCVALVGCFAFTLLPTSSQSSLMGFKS